MSIMNDITTDMLAKYRNTPRPIHIDPAGLAMWRAIGWHMAAKADKLGPEPLLDTMAAMICRLGVLEMRPGGGLFGL